MVKVGNSISALLGILIPLLTFGRGWHYLLRQLMHRFNPSGGLIVVRTNGGVAAEVLGRVSIPRAG